MRGAVVATATVLALMVLAGGFVFLTGTFAFFSPLPEPVKDVAAIISIAADMPAVSDGATKLIGVETDGVSASFRLSLSAEITKADWDRAGDGLRRTISDRFCEVRDWRDYLSRGGVATLIYVDVEGVEIGKFPVDPSRCTTASRAR